LIIDISIFKKFPQPKLIINITKYYIIVSRKPNQYQNIPKTQKDMKSNKILVGYSLSREQMIIAAKNNPENLVINIKCKGNQYIFTHNSNNNKNPIISTNPIEDSYLYDLLDIEKYDSWEIINEENITEKNLNTAHKAMYEVGSIFNQKIMIRNTIISDTTLNYLKNSLINLPLLRKNNSLGKLNNYYLNKPALIVSAGPSLNKQIKILKENQDKFIIICVNQIYKLLLNNEIFPNIVICLDSGATPNWNKNSATKKTTYFIDVGCKKEVILSSGHNTFFTTTNIDIANILSDFDINVELLETGGSVATSAYSLAKVLGCNPIVLIGQDLALTNNKDHADGYKDIYTKELLTQRKELGFEVPGYYGGFVKTERQLNFYLKWFEANFTKNNELVIFNCTEGGANIKGAINIPFKEVIEELKKFKYEISPINDIIGNKELINGNIDLINNIHTYIFEIDQIIRNLDNVKSFRHEDNFNMQNVIGSSGTLTKIIIAYFCQKQLYEFNIKISRTIDRTKEELDDINRIFADSLRTGLTKSREFLKKILEEYNN